MDNLKPGLEAILFTCDEPITLGRLKDIFPEAKPEEIREALAGLKAEYEQTGRAFTLEEIAGGYFEALKPFIGRVYHLRFDEICGATQVEQGYFSEPAHVD